jgi:hypothetical protein
MHFQCSFSKFEVKFHTSVLFFQINHFAYNQNHGLHLTCTTINTHWEATQRVMVAKLIRLSHKILIQLQLVAECHTICSSHSGWPVQKLLDTPLYLMH